MTFLNSRKVFIIVYWSIFHIFFVRFDKPPSSLMDSITSPKVKTTEGEGVGAHSLVRNILEVEGCVGALGWD
jgi:hypothetical protein